ncbi:glycoside hydrolase family 2 TIM barrel-domain containing protein [Cesiribacter sp. SM1]|uniref:glycoside hydrolase family 2 TIM barrel-domain containing protein n=1 Tax=Cesiribacter sp. SM1 TaxID=2861196 RepID=UPI001CD4AA3F|nr:glycoside hydrolase family 2 TIM barrel-domain containing protein [Cesiribacter sp. SM1]
MIRIFWAFTLSTVLFASMAASGQSTIKKSINTNWIFHKGNLEGVPSGSLEEGEWEQVSLPHSWNTADVLDDEAGYYRGVGWYRKELFVSPTDKDKKAFLFFEGVNQEATVYVNGKLAGTHAGGYTRFCFPVDHLLTYEEGVANEILLKVDNSHNEDIPPLSADFTFFGGLYRDVYLITKNKVFFDLSDHAATGIFVTTPAVTKEKASVQVKATVVNSALLAKALTVESTIRDKKGRLIARAKQKLHAKPQQKATFTLTFKDISSPQLWSPEDPYLYTIETTIREGAETDPLDSVVHPLGFRWFSFDPGKGFFLNGVPYKLIGASRHQDYDQMGNALPDAMHVQDVTMLKEMGANFLRVAHYPQDPAVLEACDRLGLLASVEIPVVNQISESRAFAENSKWMMLEMIRQNYNHPSVIIWAYMNEVLLRPKYKDQPERQAAYFKEVAALARELEALTRKEDPYRYTMIPNHGDFNRYNEVGLTEIPMLVGWNLYQGWYGANLEGFAAFLDRHRKELPHKPLLVTEYGADADPRLRSFAPERFDMTVEYATIYHAYYLEEMMKRPFVAAAMFWNLADFNSEERIDAVPHINNKGILGIDRKPKDTYFYYQAHLLGSPFLKIGSSQWTLRSGLADAPDLQVSSQPLEVYTNLDSVSLSVNGRKIGGKKAVNRLAVFNVPFADGVNQVEVASMKDGVLYKDRTKITFKLLPRNFRTTIAFREINISAGDKRYFTDEKLQQVWLPDQPYEAGSYGWVGGRPFTLQHQYRQGYGTDKNIKGTNYDPIYQTQITGIRQYKLDVPPGQYELTLHFAELLSDKEQQVLAYNLNSATAKETLHQRVFDVLINGEYVLQPLSNQQELIPERAYSTKVMITVEGEEGIEIRFQPRQGEAILNGLQLRKLY